MSQPITALDALTGIPRISQDEWRATSALTRWMVASRAAVLVMTFASAAIGGLLALLHGTFDGAGWTLCTIGLLLAHAANNQINDLTDSARGIDKGNYFRNQYGAHVIEHGLLTRQQLMSMFIATGVAALTFGVWLWTRNGSDVLWLMGAGAVFLLAYTYPMKQWGLGELAVLLVWGPLMVGGTYLVTAGHWSNTVAWIGTLYGLAPTAVIFGKHIDKFDFDEDKGVRTLPVRMGERAARGSVIAMVVIQLLALPLFVVSGALPWPSLLALLTLPSAWNLVRVCRAPRPTVCPADYPSRAWPLWFASFAFVHARNFGVLLACGLLIGWTLSA